MRAILKIFSFLILFFCFTISNSKAQGYINSRFSAELLKDSLRLNPGQFGFNSIRLQNLSNENLQISLQASLPSNWSLLFPLPELVQLSPGQLQIVSIRFKSNAIELGDNEKTFIISATDVSSREQRQASFYVSAIKTTKWKAILLKPDIFTNENEYLPEFHLKLVNEGTSLEVFDLEFETNFRLNVPSKGTQIMLHPGVDTTLNIRVMARTLDQINQSVNISIESRGQKTILTQNIHILASKYKAPGHKYEVLPIIARWDFIDAIRGLGGTNIFDLSGQYKLPKSYYLSFRARNFFNNNVWSANNSMFNIELKRKRQMLNIGNIQNTHYTFNYGLGLRYQYRGKYTQWGGSYIKSFGNAGFLAMVDNVINLGKQKNLKNELLHQFDLVTQTQNTTAISHLILSNTARFELNFHGGMSNERYRTLDTSRLGLNYGYLFKWKNDKVMIRSQLDTYAPIFVGINRGLNIQNHYFSWNPNKKFGSNSYAFISERNPLIRRDELFQSDYSIKSRAFGQELQFHSRNTSWNVGASHNSQVQNGFISNSFNFIRASVGFGQKYGLFRNQLNLSYNKINDLHEKDSKTLSASWSAAVRTSYKWLNYNGQIDHGPVNVYDQQILKQTGELPIRNQQNLFVQLPNIKNFESSIGLNYFSYLDFKNFGFQTESNWQLNNGLNIGLTSSWNLLSKSEKPFISISLLKNLNLPIPFLKRTKSFSLKLFKDENRNGKRDFNESAIDNSVVLFANKYLKSDDQGNIEVNNLKKGPHGIDLTKISNLKGWVPDMTAVDTINIRKIDVLEIPFKKSSVISGKVVLEIEDPAIVKRNLLGGIKIGAENSIGKNFYTITDDEGDFHLNLPEDNYHLKIITQLSDQQFSIQNPIQFVNVSSDHSPEVIFKIVLKRRKLNIRKAED